MNDDIKIILLSFSIAIVLNVLSVLFTSLIIWLICLCFGWQFKFIYAIGIWLILAILKSIFKNN